MKVKVKLVPGEKEVNVQFKKSKIRIMDILEDLGIDRETVLVLVHGELTPEEEYVTDGDEVEILQVISGG